MSYKEMRCDCIDSKWHMLSAFIYGCVVVCLHKSSHSIWWTVYVPYTGTMDTNFCNTNDQLREHIETVFQITATQTSEPIADQSTHPFWMFNTVTGRRWVLRSICRWMQFTKVIGLLIIHSSCQKIINPERLLVWCQCRLFVSLAMVHICSE